MGIGISVPEQTISPDAVEDLIYKIVNMHLCMVYYKGTFICCLDYNKLMMNIIYQYMYTLLLANENLEFQFMDLWESVPDVKFTPDFIKKQQLTKINLETDICYQLLAGPVKEKNFCTLCGIAKCSSLHAANNIYCEILLSDGWFSMGHNWYVSSPKLETRGNTYVLLVNVEKEQITMIRNGVKIMGHKFPAKFVDLIKTSYAKGMVASLQSYCFLSIWTNDIIDLYDNVPHLKEFKKVSKYIKRQNLDTLGVTPFGWWKDEIIESVDEPPGYRCWPTDEDKRKYCYMPKPLTDVEIVRDDDDEDKN